MNKLLYTVEELFSSNGYLFEQNKKYFNIPLYQRGYKWESKHVNKLLVDIDNFKLSGNKFYCLQNITIVPHDNVFNVIDGQQRLTTLIILLSYLGEKQIVQNKVCFPDNSIRKETNSFLNEIITKNGGIFPQVTWENFIKEFENYDHQDISHIFNAHQVIEKWFQQKEKDGTFKKSDFLDKILKNVKFIINKVEDKTSEEKIFGNLNSKRVPLDGSDLVRAILITDVANEEGKREADIKNIVRVNERRVKIGWELDQINAWWSKNEVKGYFKSFIRAESEKTGKGIKLFKDEKYPINLLFLLFAEKRGEKLLTLELIEKNQGNALGLYKEIIKLHSMLQDWYQDREIYHYLGFLFNNTRKEQLNFTHIFSLWADCDSRITFKLSLKELIKEKIFNNEIPSFENENLNWYNDQQGMLIKTLLLIDIIHSIKTNQSFLPYHAFTKVENDIEHIFPQNPGEVERKKEYIEFINKNVLKDKEKEFNLTNYDENINNEAYLLNVENFIKEQIKEININSIGNLVLLYYSLNRSLGRISYSKKRARVIEYFNEEGKFIQPHTFRVFVRYFLDENEGNKDLEYWTNNDIKSNAKAISKLIDTFFNS